LLFTELNFIEESPYKPDTFALGIFMRKLLELPTKLPTDLKLLVPLEVFNHSVTHYNTKLKKPMNLWSLCL